MYATRQLVCRLVGLTMLLPFTGCGGPDDDLEYDEAISALNFTGFFIYDAGTTCSVGGATMHCCPSDMAMIGAHVDNNVFKCAQLKAVGGGPFLDVGTERNGMHACPSGTVMVGLHVDNNQLACQAPSPGPFFEYVDGNPPTADSYPMHICPSGYAMGGIHVDHNFFTCDF